MAKSPRTIVLLYILLGYVLLQFSWWAFLIYDLNSEVVLISGNGGDQDLLRNKLYMILGEGSVFATLLIIGAMYIRNYLLKERKLAQQERNFLLATTHELNSPIAAAKLNFQTLKRSEISQDQTERMIDSGIKNLDRLEALVRNILTASRIDSGKLTLHKEEVNMFDVINKCVSNFSTLMRESSISIETDVDPRSTVIADKHSMEIIVSNLMENAVKYAPNSTVKISTSTNKTHFIFEYTDTGSGVSERALGFILNKFYRAENEETRTQKGTGLGLYLVRELIELHGGSIRLGINQPRGLMITINLPFNGK